MAEPNKTGRQVRRIAAIIQLLGAAMGKLDGKVVIVTGASRGIGKTIAEVFAAEGGKSRLRRPHAARGRPPARRLARTHGRRHQEGRRRSDRDRGRHLRLHEECIRVVDEVHKALRPGRRAGEQRGAHLLHPDQGLPGEPLAPLDRRELPRAVLPQPARPAGHDREGRGLDREHLQRRGDRPGPRPLRRTPRAAAAARSTARRRPPSSASPRASRARSTATA